MRYSLLLLLIITLLPTMAYGQSAEWLVKPDRFTEMKYFGPDMYKVTQNGKSGIVSNTGKTILEPIYDAINLFYEGRTVFVNKTQQGWQVKGVLAEDGTVAYTKDEYYLLPEYMFYSEGFLPVKDSNGRYGYLDDEAKPAFPFIAGQVRPFSEGLAAVGEGETFHWITTDGTEILPRLSNGGTPWGGTNFSNGMAYLWDEDGVWFTLDSIGESRKTKLEVENVDYLYRTCSGCDKDVPYTKYSPANPDATWKPNMSGSKWSYISDTGKLLMPFQFDTVEPFYDGVAIASVGGKYGLLHVVADKSTFSTHADRKDHVFSSGAACNCEFQLSVPEKWKNQDITVVMKDSETGETISLRKDRNNEYTFTYRPDNKRRREEKHFNVEVSNNGIQLWHGEQRFSFVQRVKLASRISVNNATANARDLCSVTAVIKNPSPVAVTTTVTLTGGGSSSQFNKKTVTITIPANSSRSINSSFMVRKVELNGWCAVSTSDGTGDRKSNLQFRPNF